MESHQNPALFSSLQELIGALENFIALESDRSGNPWISMTKLTELFYQKYGVSPGEVAEAQGYHKDLRDLFTSSRRFSIYATPMPQEFYVALSQAVVPGFKEPQPASVRCRMKQPWRVDGNLLRMLKVEAVEKNPPRPTQTISEYQPILVPEIKSVNDLELALIEIIKSLTSNHPSKIVTIGALSKKFCDFYRQPIRTVVRSMCPDMKLIELLQVIPNLHVQKMDDEWQIAVESYSVE